MDNLTAEQYKELRRQGLSQSQISDLQKRGKISETLNKKTFSEKGLVRSVGSFLGMEEFGRGLAATINKPAQEKLRSNTIAQTEQSQNDLIAAIKSNREKGVDTSRLEAALQDSIKSSQEYAGTFKEQADLGVSNREVVGSAIQTGLTFGSLLGAGPTAKGAGTVLGLTKPTVGQAVVRGAAAGAAGGAAFGAAEAVTEGTPVATGALKSAAAGAVTGGILSGATQYISNLAGKTPTDRLIEQTDAVKTVKKNFDKNTIYRTVNGKKEIVSDPISTMVEAGVKPKVVNGKINTEQAREQIRGLIDERKSDVAQAIASATDEGTTTSLMTLKQATLEKVRSDANLRARGVVGKTEKEIERIFTDFLDSYGDELTTANVNSIREGMNRVFNADTIDAERAIGDAARRYVYQNAPGTRELLVREGQLIAADKFLDALHGRAVQGGKLGGYFNNLVGAIAGSTTEVPVVGPVAGAIGMNKLTEIIQKNALDPISSKMARGLVGAVNSLPTDAAGNISKTAILSLIGQLGGQSEE
ncbi:hypothetical protein KC902_03215 [Candidatus Kaiserbacteria bacterium]|nr:hypothetical protein [Candidatus Kaiserbacteria bacterium]